MCRVFYPTTAQYTFFSEANETFFNIDFILVCLACSNKYKAKEIIPCIPRNHIALELEIGH